VSARDEEDHPDVVVCPGGPLLLRGDHVVEDADGQVHRTTRPVSAVCRCGRTGTAPWCDGTHQQLPRRQRP
jgi:CDGSH-type Zn-finger protein